LTAPKPPGKSAGLSVKRGLRALPLLFLLAFPLRAEEFHYQYKTGDKYRIISRVFEDVYLDRRLNHHAEILNRIAVEITGVRGESGRHEALFQTAEKARGAGGNPEGRSFQWAREYDSIFERDKQGRIAIDKKYFMPVVRDVPVFPGRDLKVGETWTAEGHEMHDFRDSFGIEEPYRIPFTARYTFLGNREWRGKTYPAFSVSYRIFAEPDPVRGRIWPRRIMGASDQQVYWDRELGQAAAYEETFRMIFELSNGRTVEYRGRAEAEILEALKMDREQMARDIAEDLELLEIPDVSVRASDEGVIISLDNINFQADSTRLLPGEETKLEKIARILRRYPDRDILVGGHTALAGTEEGRRKLSQDRASLVADYLIRENVRGADRVVVRGYGADSPVADNTTEEGRQKNRRVEIILLEN
jgi:outer membrane protein OmpA-like peptidoglycan-associated protein